jgi:hypothetical protein
VRRLAYPDTITGDQPTLRPVARRWAALDVDGMDRPAYVPADDLFACGMHAVLRLPGAFRGARCLVQASAGHGLKPGCRLRMWFWLDRFVTGPELEQWCKGFPIDPCTFRTAQPIYTAAPVFVGRTDHLPSRLTELPGAAMVAVPSAAALKPPDNPKPEARPASASGKKVSADRIQALIDRALDRVGNAPELGKHYALRGTARLLGGIAAEAGLSDAYLTDLLLGALPSTVRDWNGARDTAEWGLRIGRERPIDFEESGSRDPRRKETASWACRLLRRGMTTEDVIATLRDRNQGRDPLSENDLASTARWAERKLKDHADAA